jgi:hypothetical protein
MSTLRDPGPLQRKSLQQGDELLPGHPALLTSPPQPLLQQPTGLVEECMQASVVADHPVVIIVPTKPRIQRLDQLANRQVTLSLEPLGHAGQRSPKPLARRPAGHPRNSLVVHHPAKLEPEELEPLRVLAQLESAEPLQKVLGTYSRFKKSLALIPHLFPVAGRCQACFKKSLALIPTYSQAGVAR